MPRIPITRFKGRIPAALDRDLTPDFAAVATNCDLSRNRIEPFASPSFTKTLTPGSASAEVRTISRYETSFWLNWTALVHAKPAPVATDTYKRLFWTGDGAYPKKADFTTLTSNGPDGALPSGSYTLGVKKPTNAPTHGTDNLGTSTTKQDLAYVYTFVTPWGEESGPSPALSVESIPIDTFDGVGTLYVQLTGLDADPGAPYNLTGGTKRIYRTNGGGAASSVNSYLRVAEIAIATTSYNDSIKPSALGTLLPSIYINAAGAITTWDEPVAGLSGLTSLQNAVMAGFSGKTVYFSEPGFPHAWPLAYGRNVAYPVVGCGAVGTSLFVLTEGYPYVFFGEHPALMAKEKLPIQQSCVSAASVLEIPGGVMYASPDGLIVLSPGGQLMLTAGLYTRKQWQALNPSSMWCSWYNNRAYVFYRTTAGVQGGIIIDPAHPENGIVDLSSWYSAGFYDATVDTLFLVSGSQVYAWDAHPTEVGEALWTSAKIISPPFSFAAAAAQIDPSERLSTEQLAVYQAARDAAEVANAAVFTANSGFLGWSALGVGAELNGSGFLDLPSIPAGSTQLEYYTEGVLRRIATVNTDEPVRLPSQRLDRRHQIGVRGKIAVEALTLGGSMTEVA